MAPSLLPPTRKPTPAGMTRSGAFMPQPKMNGSPASPRHTAPRATEAEAEAEAEASSPAGVNMPPLRVLRWGETSPSHPKRSM